MRRAITLWILIRLYIWMTRNAPHSVDLNHRIRGNLYYLILQTLGDTP